MVTIQAHRNAIGSYYDKPHFLSLYRHGNSNSLSRHTNCKNPVIKIKVFVKLFGKLLLKMILVLFCVRLIVQVVISDKLLEEGDIENNPVPTFNTERNRELFGETSGI